MSDTTYVIGHKSPDTDTVVSAIVAADFLNQRESTTKYEPRITGDINTETQFVLDNFMVEVPPVLTDAAGADIVLVDHNEASQVVDGDKNIIGIIDHHKLNFTGSDPIEVVMQPWGSTATVLLDMYAKEDLEVPAHLVGILLAAILSDTVILRSPTTTDRDRIMVETIAEALEIDYEDLGMKMFKAKAQVASKSAIEIIHNDYKDFEIGGKKIGIGQIETPDLAELEPKLAEIEQAMSSIKSDGYHSIILMLTDILKEGTELLIVSDNESAIASAFNTSLTANKSSFIPGMMSRKKQVVPVLTEVLR